MGPLERRPVPQAATNDELRAHPDYQERAGGAVIAAAPFQAKIETAA
jgi:hypothetical protein